MVIEGSEQSRDLDYECVSSGRYFCDSLLQIDHDVVSAAGSGWNAYLQPHVPLLGGLQLDLQQSNACRDAVDGPSVREVRGGRQRGMRSGAGGGDMTTQIIQSRAEAR
jgi:hypothetical protein